MVVVAVVVVVVVVVLVVSSRRRCVWLTTNHPRSAERQENPGS